jgi:hypothetical protein
MRNPSWLLGPLSLLAAAALAAPPDAAEVPPKPVDGKITWVHDYEEARKQARQNGKPLFVVFRCER